MTERDYYEVRPPVLTELELVQGLRHEVLDPQRRTPSDISLGPQDFDAAYIHMAAFDGNKVVSTVRLNPLREDEHIFTIRKMATAVAYQGRGLGGKVLRAAEQTAIERGAERFTLDARQEAVHFYSRHGYEETGERVVREDGIINLTMTKQANNGEA